MDNDDMHDWYFDYINYNLTTQVGVLFNCSSQVCYRKKPKSNFLLNRFRFL